MPIIKDQKPLFSNLPNQHFFREFHCWLTEYQRRLEYLLQDEEIPGQTSQGLLKSLKVYPRQRKKCFFCQQTAPHTFYLEHSDFWACLDCYDKYDQLKRLSQAIKYEASNRQFPCSQYCSTKCRSNDHEIA